MALVDNFLGNNQHGSSRLMMIQARFQQRQQEEKEHKLFAMLEEQHDATAGEGGGGLGLMPAARTNSNGSSASQHTSASSTASLSSSMGSSLASSLGSTGSGMAVPGGKVRQMFEDRRNQINGRPPVYTKNVDSRRAVANTTRGWDRSHPLDPLPVNSHDRQTKITARDQQQRSRARGVSLERGARAFGDGTSDSMRRSKSQYQVDDGVTTINRSPSKLLSPSDGTHLLNVTGSLKPKSMTSLLDDNQNNVNNTLNNKTVPRFGYNQSPVRNPAPRYQVSSYREDVVDNGGRMGGQNYRGRNDGFQADDSGRQAANLAAAAAAAAAEATRRLEREKAQIQAEAKRREEELMNTIRQQQQQLQRLQQAAALAEQKAKMASEAAATATASRTSRPARTSYRASPPEESDDSKSTISDETPTVSHNSRSWRPSPTMKKFSPPPESITASPKPKLAPKPVIESPPATVKTASPRKSIFATGPGTSKDGLVACSLCGRSFASDRIEKHESICAKTKSKKRKVFDITKMRVKGTEAESFVLSAPTSRNNQSTMNNKKPISIGQHILQQQQQATRATAAPSAKPSEDGKKADWRKKHESFIEAIRAAKAVQKHLKNGGKISDLPPPPPSDTSDYIQCPHCMRRFSPGAADRHIPKCANIKSNKPK